MGVRVGEGGSDMATGVGEGMGELYVWGWAIWVWMCVGEEGWGEFIAMEIIQLIEWVCHTSACIHVGEWREKEQA